MSGLKRLLTFSICLFLPWVGMAQFSNSGSLNLLSSTDRQYPVLIGNTATTTSTNPLHVYRLSSASPLLTGFPNVYAASVEHNFTSSSTTSGHVGGFMSQSVANGGGNLDNFGSLYGFAHAGSSQSGTISTMNGFSGLTWNQSTGTITNINGMSGSVYNNTTAGTVLNMRGINALLHIDNGSATNAYGIDIEFDAIPNSATNAYGLYIDAVDFATTNNYSIYGNGGTVLFEGSIGNAPADAIETRLMWIPSKDAFRAGKMTMLGYWDNSHIGSQSWAGGLNTIASGGASFAFGDLSLATGQTAIALGTECEAVATYSVALGYSNEAKAIGSFAANYNTEVESEAFYSAAFNENTLVTGKRSAAFGNTSVVNADEAFALGSNLTVDAVNCFVVGRYNSYGYDGTGGAGANSSSPTFSRTTWVDKDALFVVGNGSSSSRSDAFVVLKNGQTYINGPSSAGGPPPISTSPALTVTGDVLVNGNGQYNTFWSTSDVRYKQNIENLESPLSTLRKLRGVSYNFNVDGYPEKGFNEGKQFGFLAQELKDVCPNLVKEDENGFYSVNYDGVIPILVEAVKEQQDQLDELEQLKKELAEIKAMLADGNLSGQGSDDNEIKKDNVNEAALYQNSPNPFGTATTINYALPSSYSNATIKIMNVVQGSTIKEYSLAGTGVGSVNVDLSEYSSGSYVYVLIVDGEVIDTKAMIMNK